MEEVDELLNGGDSVQTTETTTVTKDPVSPDKPFEINGRTYTQAEFAEMAKDYENLAKQQGKLANEVGELRKKVAPAKETVTTSTTDTPLTPEQIAQAKKELKENFGVVTEEDLDRRDYTKAADAEINRIAKKYNIDKEAFGNELVGIGVRLNPEKFEKVWIANHTDEYLTWKKEAMKKDKVEAPYTVRPVKEGLELPSQAKPRFGETVVSKALELIGATEGANA